jgi:lysophospholipase L1-like esterase
VAFRAFMAPKIAPRPAAAVRLAVLETPGWDGRPPVRRLLVKSALSIAVGALAALGGEIWLRCFAPVGYLAPSAGPSDADELWGANVHVRSDRPGLAYELAPNLDCTARGMRIVTNSLGMRDDEPRDRGDGHVRIAVLGDSMTFGFGVQQGEDFPAQLERMLAERSPPVEVLNFGVGGYSLEDELATLRAKVLPLEPDLVVVAYCLNDPEIDPIQPLQLAFRGVAWWRRSHLLRWIASRIRGRRIEVHGGGSYWRALHAPDGPWWPEAARDLDGIRDECRARNVGVVFAILPMLDGRRLEGKAPRGAYPWDDVHEHVAREARERGFDVLDLRACFDDVDPADVLVAPDDSHFNAEGLRRIAAALAARSREREELVER